MKETQELVTVVDTSVDIWVGKGKKGDRFLK